MATPQENLSRFQEIANRGLQDQLPADKRARFDEAIRRGIITQGAAPEAPQQQLQPVPQRGRPARAERLQSERLQEREQFLSSLPPERRALVEETGPLQTFGVGVAQKAIDLAGLVGFEAGQDPEVQNAIAILERANPVEFGLGEIAAETAPFLPAGLAVGAIKGLVPRVAATAGLGATEGAAIAGTEGGDVPTGALVGGAVAGAVELGVPVIGKLGGSLIRKLTGSSPKGSVIDAAGNPSQEFTQALERSGQTFDDVVRETQKELKREVVDPEQAARKAFLEAQGLTGEAAPTRAQITRSVDDFKIQQEAAKSSGRIEARLAAQDQVLSSRFDSAVLGTEGEAFGPTSSVADALVSKASTLDKEISSLYKTARERAAGEKNVRFNRLTAKLRDLAPSNRRSGGNVEAVVGDLQAKGVLDSDMNVVGKIDVETAEDVRKLMNELFDPQNGFGNSVLRQLKDELDKDVFKASGNDVFQSARKAKFDFEQGLSRAKISKFDSRKQNVVRDILENKIDPDQLAEKVVFSKATRSADLKQVVDYLSDTDAGLAAVNDLKGETLQMIKDRSFIGAEDADGFRALSRDKLEKSIKSIGDEKLKILFSPDERKFLNDMIKVTKIREPRRGTQQGLGPSAQAALRLERKLADLPVIGSVFGFLDTDVAGRMSVRARPQRVIQSPTTIEGAARRVTAPAALATSAAVAQEDQ